MHLKHNMNFRISLDRDQEDAYRLTSGQRIASCRDDNEVGLSMSQRAIRHYILSVSTTGFAAMRQSVVLKTTLMLTLIQKQQLKTECCRNLVFCIHTKGLKICTQHSG